MMPDAQSGSIWTLQKILLVLGSVVVGILIWIYVSSPIITSVVGVGEVSAPASNATISFSISATSDSPQGAIAGVTEKAANLTEFLKTKGIAESDIAQGQVTAVPSGLVTQGSSGYQATITMAAKTVHVSTISSLISDLYTNGALVVSQPVLSVENRDALEKEAYDIAMKDAKSQSSKLALSNWKLFKKIVAVTQATSGGTSTATTRPDTLTANPTQEAIDNGVFKIVKTVTVTYKLW